MSDKAAAEGGAYSENPDFVPNLTDIHGQFNTVGIGAHHDPSVVNPIFDQDKKNVANQIKAALDPEDPEPATNVLTTVPTVVQAVDPDAELAALEAKADALLDEPKPAKKASAKKEDQG